MSENTFDYIIAGGGMSGLSLAFHLNQSILGKKKILIIDREKKNQNDHTWCFWEKEANPFESIVYKKWNGVWFHGTKGFTNFLSLERYVYKMIRAIDFYKFVFAQVKKNKNFTFIESDILSIENDCVVTEQGSFYSREFIFDSVTGKKYDDPKNYNLWQHFLGWTITTKENLFNPNEPTLFDFRVKQNDECRFAYILPIESNKALIEFTVFSDNLLLRAEYEKNLQDYIAKVLKIDDYKILETEYGVIPMSDEYHEQFPAKKIVRIGTSGGYVKASTGYSFQRTQRRLQQLVKELETGKISNGSGLRKKWKDYLDSVLLNVLLTKKHPSDDVFTHLFKNNKTSQVLKFLDEDTNLVEDLKVMQSVPIVPFTKAAFETIKKKCLD